MAKPFLEAPPKYDVGKKEFSQLNLPDEIKSTLTQFAKHNLEVYNPPYDRAEKDFHDWFGFKEFQKAEKDDYHVHGCDSRERLVEGGNLLEDVLDEK